MAQAWTPTAVERHRRSSCPPDGACHRRLDTRSDWARARHLVLATAALRHFELPGNRFRLSMKLRRNVTAGSAQPAAEGWRDPARR